MVVRHKIARKLYDIVSNIRGAPTPCRHLSTATASVLVEQGSDSSDKSIDAIESIVNRHFPEIKNFQKLGYFTRDNPQMYRYQPNTNGSASLLRSQDLFHHGDYDQLPKQARTIEELQNSLPFHFTDRDPTQTEMVGLGESYTKSDFLAYHVAVARHQMDPDEIDFLFQGPILAVLATSSRVDKRTKYRVQQIPRSKTIAVDCAKTYPRNPTDLGYQFERFVLGLPPYDPDAEDDDKDKGITHLQMATIHGSRVLLSATQDGIDQDGFGVEVKALKNLITGTETSLPFVPRRRWREIAWQMIGSGARTLYAGGKDEYDKAVVNVQRWSLDQILAIVMRDDDTMRSNLEASMESLKQAQSEGLFENGRIYNLHFVDYDLELTLADDRLPWIIQS